MKKEQGKALLENKLGEIETELKLVEECFKTLQVKGKELLVSAKNQLDSNKLIDVRKRLGI